MSRGLSTQNLLTGNDYPAVAAPCYIESTVATLPTGKDGSEELWKLNHYYERLDDWNDAHGIAKNPFAGPAADAVAPGVTLRFIHRRLSRYVHAMGAAGLLIEDMQEPSPPPGLLADTWGYVEAVTIPRVLLLRARRYA